MKKIYTYIIVCFFVITFGVIVSTPFYHASALDEVNVCDIDNTSALCGDETTRSDISAVIKNVVNILLYAVGVSAVVVIIFAGFRYITSAGNPQAATNAKKMLIYAVVGLLVAILSSVIAAIVWSNVSDDQEAKLIRAEQSLQLANDEVSAAEKELAEANSRLTSAQETLAKRNESVEAARIAYEESVVKDPSSARTSQLQSLYREATSLRSSAEDEVNAAQKALASAQKKLSDAHDAKSSAEKIVEEE